VILFNMGESVHCG